MEWKEDNYLQGLQDAWDSDLKERIESDPEDAEAVRVRQELDRFNQTVQTALQGEQEALRRGYEQQSDEELRAAVIDRLIDMQADLAWMNEYRKCEVWLACKENSNRRQKYFMSREEVDELSFETLTQLQEAYRSISVDITEGKDSEEMVDSSPPPAAQELQGTDNSSGQLVVTQ